LTVVFPFPAIVAEVGVMVQPRGTAVPRHAAVKSKDPAVTELFVTVNAEVWIEPGTMLETGLLSGVTTGLGGGFTTVSSHFPTAEAPVGLVAVTVRRTLPVPAVPTENVAVTVLEPPAAISPTAVHETDVTFPSAVHVRLYWVSKVPLLTTVKVTVFPVELA
jgi:hypothetical protein